MNVCILVYRLPEARALLNFALFLAIFLILLLEFVQKLLGTILDQLTLSVEQVLCTWNLCWRCEHGSDFRLDTKVEP